MFNANSGEPHYNYSLSEVDQIQIETILLETSLLLRYSFATRMEKKIAWQAARLATT
jgi:hypothetical protein